MKKKYKEKKCIICGEEATEQYDEDERNIFCGSIKCGLEIEDAKLAIADVGCN